MHYYATMVRKAPNGSSALQNIIISCDYIF